MRIVVLGLNFAPELVGVGKYTGEMAAWLAAQGHDVEVITTRPYYPDYVRPPGSWWTREIWAGCAVTRCPVYVPARPQGARRVLHLISYALSSFPAAVAAVVRRRPDVVAVIAPTLLSAPAALLLADVSGARTWLHIQDLEVDAGANLGQLSNPGIMSLARRFERAVLRRFDLVSAISEPMVRALTAKGVAAERTMVLPNWTDIEAFFPLPVVEAASTRAGFGIPQDRCIVLYAGNLGSKQGLEHVIAAAGRLAKHNTAPPLFVIAGTGSARGRLQHMASSLSNVMFMPLQPYDKFNAFLNIADIHILPQLGEVNDVVMPSKLGAMLATGRPVVATVSADSFIGRTLADAGLLVPPGHADALAEAVALLSQQPARRAEMGRAARTIAERLKGRHEILSALVTWLAEISSP